MPQPTSGQTTFDGLSTGPVAGPGSAAAPTGLTAADVAGWNITLLAADSNPDAISVDNGDFGATGNTVDGSSLVGDSNIEGLTVTPNDASAFTLDSVDVGIDMLSNGQGSGEVKLIGYRNGVAVAGATLPETVNDDGTLTTFDVSGNSAFQNITSFTVETDGTYYVNNVFGLDNIVATGFQAAGPVITTSAGNAAFTAGDNAPSAPVAVDPGLTLADVTSGTLTSATVGITNNFVQGEDVLNFTNTGDISGSYDAGTGVLTLTSAGASVAEWQAALESVTYKEIAVTPNNATRTISFSAYDGTDTSSVATRDVSVTDTDQTPILTTSGTPVSYGLSATPLQVAIDNGVTVSDADNTTLASATVSIATGFQAGDVLSFTNTSSSTFGDIAANYDGNGTLSLTSGGLASVTQWQAALDAVTFSTSSAPGARVINFAVNDGLQSSLPASDTVSVLAGASASSPPGSSSFTAGNNVTSTPVAVDPFLTVSDSYSGGTLASATVAITANFQPSEDVLAFTPNADTGNIAGSYDAVTGILTLTSSNNSATMSEWQTALDSVTYTDTAVTPNTATRTVSFTVTDGTTTSSPVTRDIAVSDTPQTPIVTTTGNTLTYVSQQTAVLVDAGVTVSDRDSPTLHSAIVTIGSGYHSGDTLAFANTSAATFGNITATYDTSDGQLHLSSSGDSATVGQWQAALDAVTFSSTSTASGNRTISYQVSDGTNLSDVGTDIVDVLHGPSIAPGSATLSVLANTAGAAIAPALAISDPDSPTLANATVSVATGFEPGDTLAFTASLATGNITATYNSGTGTLSLLSVGGTATLAQWQAALDAIVFSTTSATGGTRTISYTASDGATTSSPATATVDVLPSTTSGGTVTISSPITVTSVLTLPPGPLAIGAPAATPVTVSITAGGSIKSGGQPVTGTAGIDLANTAGSAAAVTVSGIGATLDANGSRLTIGDLGSATLTVSDGGTVLAGADYADTEAALAVASSAGSTGTVTITGTGSQLIATGPAVIGGNEAGGSGPLAGAIVFGGTVTGGTGPIAGGQGTVTVTNGGLLQTGAMTVEAGSTLTVDSASTLVTPSLTLDGGTANLGTASADTPITFGNGGTLQLQALQGADTVNNFTFGDTIDLAGVRAQSGVGSTISTANGTLTVNTASGVTAYMSDDGHGGTLITPTSDTIGVYRFFETGSGVHLYTTSATEAQTIEQTRPDEIFEGIGMTALTPGNGDPNAAPIYRFFDSADGSHFYTASSTERDNIIATRPDMVYEAGGTFYEHLNPQPGDVPVYRFFDSSNGTHFYTDSATERASVLSTRPDMIAEGISFYEAPRTSTTA